MKYKLIIASLLAIASLKAFTLPTIPAFDATLNAQYDSKLIQQGSLQGSSVVTADVGTTVYGIGLDVKDYSQSANFNYRQDVDASYEFTSVFANATVGAEYSNNHANGFLTSVSPFVRFDGTALKLFPWSVTARFDTRNLSDNYEAKVTVPVYTWQTVKITSTLGVGYTNPGSLSVATLETAKRYELASVDVSYPIYYGSLTAGVYAKRDVVTSNTGQIVGFDVGLGFKF